MQLFDYYRSSAAYRVRIALNIKGIDAQRMPIDLSQAQQLSEDFRELNPQGLVPALMVAEGAVLNQSVAILEWLEETHPQPPLLPTDSLARARVRAMVNIIACDIHPLNNLRVLKFLTGELALSEEQKLQWYHHWLGLGFAALEQTVTGEQYCFGDKLSFADVCLVPQMYNARRFKLPLDAYPRLVAISSHLEAIPAFLEAAPDAGK